MVQEFLTPQALLDAYQGKAGLLCRCILFGIVEPPVEMDQMLQQTLANTIIEECGDYTKHEFRNRFPRALKWACREEVDPTFGIFTIEKVLSTCSKQIRRMVEAMPEYKEYQAKHGETLAIIYAD
jgi:hypothetical protein